jgi:hypothetical protein
LATTAFGGRPPAREQVPADYVAALRAANTFLTAWAARDQEGGLRSVSARVRRLHPEAELRMYFSGLSNPHHAGFEIHRGRRVSAGRYAFPIRLFEFYTGEKRGAPLPPLTLLTVVRVQPATRNADAVWAVDALQGEPAR